MKHQCVAMAGLSGLHRRLNLHRQKLSTVPPVGRHVRVAVQPFLNRVSHPPVRHHPRAAQGEICFRVRVVVRKVLRDLVTIVRVPRLDHHHGIAEHVETDGADEICGGSASGHGHRCNLGARVSGRPPPRGGRLAPLGWRHRNAVGRRSPVTGTRSDGQDLFVNSFGGNIEVDKSNSTTLTPNRPAEARFPPRHRPHPPPHPHPPVPPHSPHPSSPYAPSYPRSPRSPTTRT